jgi:hypothetical protein
MPPAGKHANGSQMAEVFVTCPECKLRVKVTPTAEEVSTPTLCNYRQNPLNCPKLLGALTIARGAVSGAPPSP